MIEYHDPAIPDDEMRTALTEADDGHCSIEAVGAEDWERQYCGVMGFRLGNGWIVAVFNDCCEWDYLEWVQAPDGRREEFSRRKTGEHALGERETFTQSEVLQSWEPSHRERWGKNCP